ncbi:MAG TPA: proline dehydrogenase family protein [Acidobacteriaceae bacterium]|nr:proline dehydrogenase family protein [Acidobacteriaceae bacterium]
MHRFVPGETLDECVAAIRELNGYGLKANTSILGEGVTSEDEADAVTSGYEVILRRLADEKLRANIAVKLSHLGVGIDEERARGRLERLLGLAASLGNFIRIDMEDSRLTDVTLRTYRMMREAGHANVGVALQAYLYRTAADLEALLPLQPNVRIVKGAYLEPAAISYPNKADVDANYIRLAERALEGGAYTAIATHDENIIDHFKRFTAERKLDPRSRFEFQLLYGIRPTLQRALAAEGYEVLVATPYGPEWYPYLMRRLAERPANVLFFARNLVRG